MEQQLTNEEILANNRLISEFMGAKFEPKHIISAYPQGIEVMMYPSGQTPVGNILRAWSIEHLSYHKSWDWLMPVIEKIEQFSIGDYQFFSFRISNNRCSIYCHERNKMSGRIYETGWGITPDSKLMEAYKGVVEFIKWFTPQKEKSHE